jgi:hypothetical protein
VWGHPFLYQRATLPGLGRPLLYQRATIPGLVHLLLYQWATLPGQVHPFLYQWATLPGLVHLVLYQRATLPGQVHPLLYQRATVQGLDRMALDHHTARRWGVRTPLKLWLTIRHEYVRMSLVPGILMERRNRDLLLRVGEE